MTIVFFMIASIQLHFQWLMRRPSTKHMRAFLAGNWLSAAIKSSPIHKFVHTRIYYRAHTHIHTCTKTHVHRHILKRTHVASAAEATPFHALRDAPLSVRASAAVDRLLSQYTTPAAVQVRGRNGRVGAVMYLIRWGGWDGSNYVCIIGWGGCNCVCIIG